MDTTEHKHKQASKVLISTQVRIIVLFGDEDERRLLKVLAMF